MARAARDRRVFFVEEPTDAGTALPHLTTAMREGVTVVTPHLPAGLTADARFVALRSLVDDLVRAERIRQPVLWYYTPMALPWTRHLRAAATVFDSMDNLAGFRGAAPELLRLEAELVERSDLVFCGGASLHERMRHRHRASHSFPSSVDVAHFARARAGLPDPADQAAIERPRIGYAGVIDERVDVALIDGIAKARPDWQVVLVGPVVKIAAEDLSTRPNIHRLGMKDYAELPAYLGGWDVGWMPFAHNDATRYISPTKTPEYLAAGLPVVSTSIRDVVEPYGAQGLVSIADGVAAATSAIEAALAGPHADRARIDMFLASRSWDRTWAAMAGLVDELAGRDLDGRAPSRRPATDLVRSGAGVGQPSAAVVQAGLAEASSAASQMAAGRAGRAGRAG
ncbi:MAG: glycosyltransferase [Chloroflexi bacterium]|nr:glycosyltransferase [Chloroflexota bacterium]